MTRERIELNLLLLSNAMHRNRCGVLLLGAIVFLAVGCGGPAVDEARLRQLDNPETKQQPIGAYAAENYPPEDQDLFAEMDQKSDHGNLYPIPHLAREEIIGRNAWMIWTGGNEAFWDWLARHGYGTLDLLKVIDDRNRGSQWSQGGLITEPGMRAPTPEETEAAFGIRFARPVQANYSYRYRYPGAETKTEYNDLYYRMMQPYGAPEEGSYEYSDYKMPKSNEVGETEGPYKNLRPPNPYIYGFSSGIVGLRLFPNPEFNPNQGFDAKRYYSDKDYASNPSTIRPFRVGMACAFCHVGPHPLNPPKSFEYPKWENLSGTIGAQYLRVRVGLGGELPKSNLFYHVLDSQLPGTIDTSLIASDAINNSNTMNAIFGLGWRVNRARFNPLEQLSQESEKFPGLWDEQYGSHLGDLLGDLKNLRGEIGEPGGYEGNPRMVPRVLVDGSDSVGSWIALARVYLNIGMYHQRWMQVHNTILGVRTQVPFRLQDCEENSVYWWATKLRVDPMTSFFLRSTDPMKLRDAPDGLKLGWGYEPDQEAGKEQDGSDVGNEAHQSQVQDQTVASADAIEESTERKAESAPSSLTQNLEIKGAFDGDPWDPSFARGRKIFARGCIACHSSVQPGTNPALEAKIVNSRLPDKRSTLDLTLDDLRELTRGSGDLPDLYALWAQHAVEHPEFWQENFLSTDRRIPVSITHTNAGRASATNAMRDHIWEDFASWTYKDLEGVGDVPYFDPISKSNKTFEPESGGPGYYRVPTLISAWATAPFFHNNSLGKFNNDPSVEGRLECYQDAMHKLLNPDLRTELGHDRGKAEAVELVDARQTSLDGGLVWRTNADCFLKIPGSNLPSLVAGITGISFTVASRIVPWVAPIVFLIFGLIFLFSSRIVEWYRSKIAPKIPFRESLAPFKVLLGIVFFLVAAAFIYLAFTRRAYIQLIEVSSDWTPWSLQIQTYLPALFVFAVGALILLTYLYERWWGRWVIYFTMLLCFVATLITGTLTGPALAGSGGTIELGPFPQGTPVNLITNIDASADLKALIPAVVALADFLRDTDPNESGALKRFEHDVAPLLLKVSKCPDLVLDHGHDYRFIQDFSDEDKFQLTELIKSF